jgi:hypothetical protein
MAATRRSGTSVPELDEEEAAALLRDHAIALVWADTGGEHPATAVQTTGALAYVRLH